MKKYKVTINGENVLMKVEGELKRLGFFITKFVEGSNLESAKDKAAELVYSETRNKPGILNQEGDGIYLTIDEIEELGSDFIFPVPQPGYSFYVQEQH